MRWWSDDDAILHNLSTTTIFITCSHTFYMHAVLVRVVSALAVLTYIFYLANYHIQDLEGNHAPWRWLGNAIPMSNCRVDVEHAIILKIWCPLSTTPETLDHRLIISPWLLFVNSMNFVKFINKSALCMESSLSQQITLPGKRVMCKYSLSQLVPFRRNLSYVSHGKGVMIDCLRKRASFTSLQEHSFNNNHWS